MNDSENFDPSPNVSSQAANLSESHWDAFQKLFLAMLVALLILSASWNVFLVRQTNLIRRDLNVIRPQVSQLAANYAKSEDPQIKSFVNALVNFGRTHPDFNPILTKYKIPLAQTPTAPASTPPTKKK